MNKLCLTLVLSVVISFVMIAPVYAITYKDVEISNVGGFGGGSRDDSATVLSYDALSALCVEVNSALGRGYYSGFSGCTAALYQVVISDYSYYVIQVTGNGSTCYVMDSGNFVRTELVAVSSGDSESISDSVIENLQCLHRHIINIQNRCEDFHVLLGQIVDMLGERLTKIQLNVGYLVTDVSSIRTRVSDVYWALTDEEDSPLLTRLDSIITALTDAESSPLLKQITDQIDVSNNYYQDLIVLLVQLRAALENLTINADSLENLTIDAYDDSMLLGYIDAIYNNNLNIQYLADTIDSNVLSIKNDISRIKSNVSTMATRITNIDSSLTALLPVVTDCSTKLSQLAASGGETPTTLHDYISMRLVPVQNLMYNSLSTISNRTLTISTNLSTLSDTETSIYALLSDAFVGEDSVIADTHDLIALIYSALDHPQSGMRLLLRSVDGRLNTINNTISNLSFSGEVSTDLTPVITSIDAVGLNIEELNTSLNANFNANIGSLLDKLDIVIEGSSESLENRINVTIDASNDAHNVFYVTGEDGEEQSVTEFTGDLTKASGRILSLLYRLVFADTLSSVDGDLDGFEDFFTSQGDDTATQAMNSPYEESENVWLAS